MDTLSVALQAVATAGVLAGSGFYLDRSNVIPRREGKRVLSRFSQQVAIPALLFCRNVECQPTSTGECPSVVLFRDPHAPILLMWPLFVVSCGLAVGYVVTRLANTPTWHASSVIASTAFANSTGLPITLLTVMKNKISSLSAGADPSFYLSLYLIGYPLLQWMVGGFLLTEGSTTPQSIELQMMKSTDSTTDSVTTNKSVSDLLAHARNEELTHRKDNIDDDDEEEGSSSQDSIEATTQRLLEANGDGKVHASPSTKPSKSTTSSRPPMVMSSCFSKACQPPVRGVLLGLFVASIPPLRALFVNTSGAPLGWLFEGIQRIGHAAIPVNMAVLGITLSQVARSKNDMSEVKSETIIGVVLGKLVVMPLVGIGSVLLLKNFAAPSDKDDESVRALYIVLMLVFVTPTANNVMVMAELSNGFAKEGVARMIFYQYLSAPFLLSLSIMAIMRVV